jgi:hypothetical protein
VHGVKHFWLCERCCHVFTLVSTKEGGVILRLLWSEHPSWSLQENCRSVKGNVAQIRTPES